MSLRFHNHNDPQQTLMALIYCNKTRVLRKSKNPLALAHEIYAQASHSCSYEGHYVRQFTYMCTSVSLSTYD